MENQPNKNLKFDANGNEITVNLYTLLTDNLGSVVAITDEQANVTQRFYYTPFGEQRQIDGKQLDAPLTHKGFTGHEEVECVNLIHMSGRMYDLFYLGNWELVSTHGGMSRYGVFFLMHV